MASSQLPRTRAGLQRLVVASVGAAGAQVADSRAALPENEEELLALVPKGVIDGVTKVIFCQSGLPTDQRQQFELLVGRAANDPSVQEAFFKSYLKTNATLRQHTPEEGEESLHRYGVRAIEDRADAKARLMADSHHDHDHEFEEASSSVSSTTEDDKVKRVVEKLHYAVECSICLESYKDARMLNCPGKHVVCRKHISSLPKADVGLWQQFLNGIMGVEARTCPCCRGSFTSYEKVRPVDDMVEVLRSVAADLIPESALFGDDDDDMESLNPEEKGGLPAWALPVVGVVLLICFLIVGKRR